MRREEKAITDKKEIERIFREAYICRLGLFDGRIPYIVPLSFGYRDNFLFFHSALSGRKIDILKKNPAVCFEIDLPGDIVNSKKACSWSMNYRSIMGEGSAVFLGDEGEKAEALNAIMHHYSEKSNWDFTGKVMERTCIFKVGIENLSAKKSGE